MSQDFAKVLVKDDRLCVTDSVRYAVIKGGANMTCAQYNAIGAPPFVSNLVFNVQVPSQETIVSRQALIRTVLRFAITSSPITFDAAIPGSGFVFQYGGIDGFSPFPFHALVNSTQWTINNNTISQNTRDLLATLVRIHDKRYLQRYNGMTPVMYDSYAQYSQIPSTANNAPFAGFSSACYDGDLLPRGVLPLSIVSGTNFAAASTRTLVVDFAVTEPCLLSPFVFAGDEGQGMYGIQNFNATYNLTGAANNVVRFGGTTARYTGAVLPTVAFQGLQSAQLLLQYLTPHPSDLLPSRNVLPYYELPRYISAVPTGASFPAGATRTVTSSSLQLNQIPDKIYIVVSKAIDQRLVTDADSFLPITGISINWNNSSGLLSSAQPQDLWRMSVENGINMSWAEWSGLANNSVASAGTGLTPIITCGPVLCLEYGKDIELKDDYYAPGSLGNFQLQFNLTVLNNTGADLAASYQMMVIVQNSGVFSLERGVSSSYLGILTKSDVLEASRTKAVPYSEAIRMVGGGKIGDFFHRVTSKLGDAGRAALPVLKDMAIGALKKQVGMGQSGGKKMKDMGGLEDRMY